MPYGVRVALTVACGCASFVLAAIAESVAVRLVRFLFVYINISLLFV